VKFYYRWFNIREVFRTDRKGFSFNSLNEFVTQKNKSGVCVCTVHENFPDLLNSEGF
jgi:hypothetical protein